MMCVVSLWRVCFVRLWFGVHCLHCCVLICRALACFRYCVSDLIGADVSDVFVSMRSVLMLICVVVCCVVVRCCALCCFVLGLLCRCCELHCGVRAALC